jgi:dipeptidyl aminopeptidase/acylaminoacyl peptidase
MSDTIEHDTVDPRIRSAISHWMPRFMAHGIAMGDFHEVTRDLVSWDEWCAAWCRRGRLHADLAVAAEQQGRLTSAAEHYLTAALCHHYGKFLFVHDLDQMAEAHRQAVDLYTRALPYLRPPGERCAVPYEDSALYGVLRRPVGAERPPVVVLVAGLDSTKEEQGPHERALLDRGLATFSFDGPGQGEAEYEHPMRHDFEVPVAAVVDHLEERDDVDGGRIALWGRSFGGRHVVRAAAFEPRVGACVSLSGPYDATEMWDERPELNRQAYIVRSHSDSADEALEKLRAFSLDGVASRVTCPIYVLAGELDRLTSYTQAERIAAEVSGPVRLNVVPGGSHTSSNKPYAYRPEAADWVAEHLGA